MKRLVLVISFFLNGLAFAQSPQWSSAAANDWYSRQPWLVGTSYIQSNTVNQIEMWRQETFDADRIDLELGWAENLGFNTIRVFLHDLVWDRDQSGFQKRIDKLLKLVDKHKMKVIFVLFDSSGDPYPDPGPQRQPKPGVRNSLWVQSPGAKALSDSKALEKVLIYAEEIVSTYSIDKRVLAWDVWNEPDNMNVGRFARAEPPKKVEWMQTILPKAFQYVRAGNPTQPITSGLWQGDWSGPATLSPIEKIQVELSDFITFQNYGAPADFEKRVKQLQAFGRPVICTGFLDRGAGNTPEAILPIAQKYNVGILARDLVAGKTQMWLPSDSWQKPYIDAQPTVWVQDFFRSTGPAYKPEENDYIKKVIASSPAKSTPKKNK